MPNIPSLSRRHVLGLLSSTASAAALGTTLRFPGRVSARTTPAGTIHVGGAILTMDDAGSRAEALLPGFLDAHAMSSWAASRP